MEEGNAKGVQDAQMDSLTALEERIHRAATLVARLRKEQEEASALTSEVDSLRSKIAELTQEVETLRAERETVRKRIGKLLEQVDALSAI